MAKKKKINPYAAYTFNEEDGSQLPKLYSHGIHKGAIVCNCCNEPKREVATMNIFGTVYQICEQCTFEMNAVWDRKRSLLVEKYKEDKFEEEEMNYLYQYDEYGYEHDYDDYEDDYNEQDPFYGEEDNFYL